MSYLEMDSAPLDNMSKGIISLWFRDPTAQADPPEPILSVKDNKTVGWPVQIPPNVPKLIASMTPSSVAYWSPYGLPQPVLGDLFLGPPAVMMPIPPPIPTDNMRMILTFGDPGQKYKAIKWEMEEPHVIPAVYLTTGALSGALAGIGWSPDNYPPPYAPYDRTKGDDGKFRVVTWRVKDATASAPDLVPQSFIGIDDQGYLTICLQTSNSAKYSGYAFQMDKVSELWASPTTVLFSDDEPPHPIKYQEHAGYWNGYQFEYEDVSNKVMGVQPETFIIGGAPRAAFDFASGPKVTGRGWHHLLFSFDIGGEVNSEQTPKQSGPPTFAVTSKCKAWLAVDDHNYSGNSLQHRVAIPNGAPGMAPKLEGTETTAILDFGPCTTAFHASLNIGSNDIVPQNVFLYSALGSPKDGLPRDASNSGIYDPPNHVSRYGMEAGVDYNALAWTAKTWPLYLTSIPGPFPAPMDPPRPDVPDPKKEFTNPTYKGGPFHIPVAGHPVGIPASTHHLKHNTGVEMANLQVWSGRTIDTADEAVRRLFIDADGKPVAPGVAAAVLGEPDIKLHGSANWQNGKNTGTTGIDRTVEPPAINPAGQFNPYAAINTFKPEPELGK